MMKKLLISVFCCFSLFAEGRSDAHADSLLSLDNPERGFYRTAGLRLKEQGNTPAALPCGPLVHLRVDLSAFSAKAGGVDAPLSPDAMLALRRTLDAVRKNGKGVIIRCCYDPAFSGKRDTEPELKLMQRHLRSLGAVYGEYTDVILCVELGMFGPWGEMHSSACCTPANVNAALDTLLDATPAKLTVNLRTPQYVAAWFGVTPSAQWDGVSPACTAALQKKGKRGQRVGLFNDGYLGSSSDLGTFAAVPRSAGVSWLKQAATHTFYGGEAVADASGSVTGAYNNLDFIAREGFETHTTYLNFEWNQKVHRAWAAATYRREGDEYSGQNGLKYVQDHLGYRLVLRSASVDTQALREKKLKVDFTLENVGFAPVIKRKKAELVLVHEDGRSTYTLACPRLDIRSLAAASSQRFRYTLPLPAALKRGEWSLYLRLACPGYETAQRPPCIRLAGSDEEWNAAEGSNLLCRFRVK